MVAAPAAESGRRIALTAKDGTSIVDTGDPGAPPLPVRPKAIVDPLNVDPVLKPDAPADAIDPRAVGPFRLTDEEATNLRYAVDRLAACSGQAVVVDPNGRPRLAGDSVSQDEKYSSAKECAGIDTSPIKTPTATEVRANGELLSLFRDCLGRVSPGFELDPDWAGQRTLQWWRSPRLAGPESTGCLASARRAQLSTHVAPPALLFPTPRTGAERPGVDLSSAGSTRIALTALGVLAVAAFAGWLVASRPARPIRAVTDAARRMGAGDRSARVTGTAGGELGDLAVAFNTMSRRVADAERQRQELIGDVAHELRTPLATITGWLDAAEDGVAEVDARLMAVLRAEAEVLHTLVDDLHDLAQADAGTLRLHREPIDAAEVVEQVVAAHRSVAGGVTLTAHVSGRPALTADPVRLRQAVRNLVTNALRYTPSGGTVTVTGERDGDDVVIEVADTGVGIDPDDLPHVFDRFWRADKSRSRATGGSGLGLAITKYLVEAHDGTVEVTSTPDVGSTFRLRFRAG